MWYYLVSLLCAVLSYDFARSFTGFKNRLKIFEHYNSILTTAEVFWYADVLILIAMFVFTKIVKRKTKLDMISVKHVYKNKLTIALLATQIVASQYKVFLVQRFMSNEIIVYSVLTPVAVMLIVTVIMKRIVPVQYYFLSCFALLGSVIANINKMSFSINGVLVGYTVVNAISEIAVNYISNKRKTLEGIFFDNMLYAITGLVLILITGSFDIRKLCTLPVLIVGILSITHHSCKILGNKKIKHIYSVVVVDSCKVLLVLLSSYVFFGYIPVLAEIVGVSMILLNCTFITKLYK